jgi:hypothetical protein
MSYECQICGEEFSTEKGLHIHIKKHKIDLATYYTTYYPRKNLLTGELLPFRNKKEYFTQDFSTRSQMLKWCLTQDKKVAGEYATSKLKERIEDKGLKRAPTHLELKIYKLPSIDVFKYAFKSYSEACKKIGYQPLLGRPMDKKFYKDSDSFSSLEILIDTREQQPLKFPKSKSLKLDFGDYTLGGSDYSYTYVDRKAEQDFKSTMTVGFERFRRELQRVKDFDSFLFIVIESDLNKIYKNNLWGPHKSNLKYIYHNMRLLMHEFADTCQFIFTGNREKSEDIIPKLLKLGKTMWGVDIQYFLDQK